MNKKLFIGLTLAFVSFTIIGTVSHEIGHYIVAKYFGYDAKINYATTYYNSSDSENLLDKDNAFLITIGGPLQTILTGSLGLILLCLFRQSFYISNKLSLRQWLIIFTSFFWLRQTANFFVWLFSFFINGRFSANGDEIKMAKYLGLPDWTVITITAFIGSVILGIVVFKFIPKSQRLTFVASGLTGGISGYVFWIVLFGKYIMP